VLTVTTTPQEAKVGITALEGRQTLRVFNTGSTIYWGYTNTVNSTTGEPIFKNQGITFSYGPDIKVWLVTASGSSPAQVRESG
jgi:hypothetical protein